jgi:hypothetical protein
MKPFLVAVALVLFVACSAASPSLRSGGFLVEEASSSELNNTQHALTVSFGWDRIGAAKEHETVWTYTMERPLFSRSLHFVLGLPAVSNRQAKSKMDLGDVSAGFRYLFAPADDPRMSMAPRLTFQYRRGFVERLGDRGFGGQFNLPLSVAISPKWTATVNAGIAVFDTLIPYYSENGDMDPPTRQLRWLQNTGGGVDFDISRKLSLSLEYVLETYGVNTEGFGYAGIGHWQAFNGHVVCPGVRYAFNFPSGRQWVIGAGIPLRFKTADNRFGVIMTTSFEYPVIAEGRR